MEENPTTIIEDVIPTVNEDPDVTQVYISYFVDFYFAPHCIFLSFILLFF